MKEKKVSDPEDHEKASSPATIILKSIQLKKERFSLSYADLWNIYASLSKTTLEYQKDIYSSWWQRFIGGNLRLLNSVNKVKIDLNDKLRDFQAETEARLNRFNELSNEDSNERKKILETEFSDLYDAEKSVSDEIFEKSKEIVEIELLCYPLNLEFSVKVLNENEKKHWSEYAKWIETLRSLDNDS